MFGGAPQPQTSRNGPKRPKTAVFGVFLMPPPQAGGEKIYYVLLLVTINFLFPGATAPKQGRGTPTSRFRPLNLRVSARAITLRSILLFDEGGGVGGVDRHLHHVQLAGVPTCAAASTPTHTAAGVGEGRGQEGCRLVRPRQAPVRVLRVVHALASRVVRPPARAFLSRSSPMIAAPRGADGRGARARCRHPAPWSPRGRRREKRQLRPRHRVPPPR